MKKHIGLLCLFAAAFAVLFSTTQPAFAQTTNTFPASGNVGIGTTLPADSLQIVGSGQQVAQVHTTSASGTNAGVEVTGGGTNADWLMLTNRGDLTANAGDLLFTNLGTSAGFVMNVNGLMGIGTTSPTAALDVQKVLTAASGQAIGGRYQQTLTAAANDDSLTGLYVNPTFNDNSKTGVNHYGLLVSSGLSGIGTTAPNVPLEIDSSSGAQLRVRYDTGGNGVLLQQTASDGIAFLNQQDNAALAFATNNSERVRIQNNGFVGIGVSTPAQALEVNGEVQIDTFAAASATTVCKNGSGVLSTCSSSIRYKENVENADMGLNDVMRMRPVTFKWKDRDENDFGFIAEEMNEINPLYNTYEKGQIEGVKYPQLTAVLVNAIKEQQQEISDLKLAISALKTATTTSAALTVAAASAH